LRMQSISWYRVSRLCVQCEAKPIECLAISHIFWGSLDNTRWEIWCCLFLQMIKKLRRRCRGVLSWVPIRLGWDHRSELALLALPGRAPQYYPRAHSRLRGDANDAPVRITPTLPLGKVILRAAGCWIAYDSIINKVLAHRLPITDLGKMVGYISVRNSAVPSVGRSDNSYVVSPVAWPWGGLNCYSTPTNP